MKKNLKTLRDRVGRWPTLHTKSPGPLENSEKKFPSSSTLSIGVLTEQTVILYPDLLPPASSTRDLVTTLNWNWALFLISSDHNLISTYSFLYSSHSLDWNNF